MKFQDKVKDIVSTLEENILGGGGNPPAVNPAQVNPAGQQQQPAPQGQQAEITADQLMQFALNSDPKQLKQLGIDPNAQGDDLFKAVHSAYMQGMQKGQPNAQMNPVAASNNTQTTSAAPVKQGSNTAGVSRI